jgi:nucleotide-binding universal stress UspA family protein
MDYRRVAVAIDFSEPSRQALREAGRIAARNAGALLALHVAEEDAVGLFARELRGDPDILRQALERQLREWLADAGLEPPGAEIRVEVGSPARDVLRLAEDFGADLLVCGTKGHSHPNRRLGTLAGTLVRGAAVPVLLVHPEASPPRTVVACVDYSPVSADIMEHALAVAETEDLEVHVIHNEPPTGDYYAHLATASGLEPYAVGTLDPDTLRRIDAGHLTRLEAFVAEWRNRVPRRLRFRLTTNFSAARGILEYAEGLAGPLLVLGTHGRSGLAQALVGTTTERVLHQCPGSALLVRAPGKEP